MEVDNGLVGLLIDQWKLRNNLNGIVDLPTHILKEQLT